MDWFVKIIYLPEAWPTYFNITKPGPLTSTSQCYDQIEAQIGLLFVRIIHLGLDWLIQIQDFSLRIIYLGGAWTS